ncbi:MAG: zf-HC2 domain-containing protein [Butyrivibrio sp.]|nr:zf-HC2 domain-containing protein [Butyrivibrio sp.]
MDCKDSIKMIPQYLNDELNINELEEFLDHVRQCDECKEELTIQFLVQEGLQRLEDGDTFNLTMELNDMLYLSGKKLQSRRNLLKFSYILQVLVIFECALVVFLSMFL